VRARPRTISIAAAVVLGLCVTNRASLAQRSTAAPAAPLSALWEEPQDLATRNLYDGPWGRENAPDPSAVYRFLRPKRGGVNPGVIVQDPLGREWHVKQMARSSTHGAEGPVEVVLSRVLSAVGYHQPPVYYLPSFMMQTTEGGTAKSEPGGRFRLSDQRLKSLGAWSWVNNPFADTQELRGLLALLLTFNSSDLKSSNNTLYEVHDRGQVTQWFVVRDIGTALGETGRLAPHRNDAALLAKEPLIAGIANGFVKFNYHGLHKDILTNRITPDDVVWASGLLAQLSDRQWHDAFRAGGYEPDVADRFIRAIRARVAEGLHLAPPTATLPRPSR